jgi:hypothetical protein
MDKLDGVDMRDWFAVQILNGICAGDWRFDIPDNKTWDEVAVSRAYGLADEMIREREISNA